MRFAIYVFLMFSLSVGFYMAGFRSEAGNTSALEQLGGQQGISTNASNGSGFMDVNNTVSNLAKNIANPNDSLASMIPTLLLVAGAATLLFLSGFSAIYILAAVMLLLFMNVFVFPTSYLFPSTMMGNLGATISLPIKILFNILSTMAILSFVKGGV